MIPGARLAGRAMLGSAFGPAGFIAPSVAKWGGRAAIVGKRARGVTMARHAAAVQRGSRVANNRAVGWMARHPVATTAIAAGPGYGLIAPQRNASQRNQNDWYLRRMRRSQQSSMVGRSIGGMTM